jgi:glyoxylase-like metal-dependent hydrolase (beta-lactamase superfamily II)
VGDQSKSGDAIALRDGNLRGPRSDQTVVVVDGGYQGSGERLVEFIRTRYRTSDVDLVISTHPDQDHVGGLEVVVEELNVRELWMHQPWAHSLDLAAAKRFGFSKVAVGEALQKSLEGASELETIATRHGIAIKEPFTGLTTADGIIEVAGSTLAYYEELLAGLARRSLRRTRSRSAPGTSRGRHPDCRPRGALPAVRTGPLNQSPPAGRGAEQRARTGAVEIAG